MTPGSNLYDFGHTPTFSYKFQHMIQAKTVDEYIGQSDQWGEALQVLRDVLLQTELEETVKWGAPAYTIDGKNIVGLGAFKQFVAVWFHQGVLLSDPKGVLINAQEGTTKALRQWRFTSIEEVEAARKDLKQYAEEAITNQREGREIKPDKKKPLIVPPELQEVLDKDTKLATQFEALNLTRKREYVEHIASAKREETKMNRLEKIKPMILEGIGLHDKYRK